MHPVSLPGFDSDGATGNNATRFMQFLADAGFSVWQMLPVQPVDQFGSPYQGLSVHAGNPRFIDQRTLVNQHWMKHSGQRDRPLPLNGVMEQAIAAFRGKASAAEQQAYEEFRVRQAYWLDDYSLFNAIKKIQHNKPWWEWEDGLRERNKDVLAGFRKMHAAMIDQLCFEQYVFFTQWHALRDAAREKGILLLGDIPMFPAHDSADVWAHPGSFKLDAYRQPAFVAGVPPDYFSATGQRWGNPLYDWEQMAREGFTWWINRFRTQLELFDLLRLDHFRGFEAVWEIPASCPTAEDGQWKQVPGRDLFRALYNEYGALPLIAEDLGVISPEVLKLRDDFNLPGMNVLQFAFDSDARNPYLPHNHKPEDMICTGTHDNDTTAGWFAGLDETVRKRVEEYLQQPARSMPWPLITTALASVCRLAILPMQDLLGLDSSHRMNTPGTVEGNWRWQFEWDWINNSLAGKLRHLNALYGRK